MMKLTYTRSPKSATRWHHKEVTMKKLMKLMVVAAIAISPLLMGASASAQQATCEIGFTGPNSDNMCVSTTKYECSVSNENVITVVNETGQTVATGTATSSGNTTGGGATSGTASNENGTNFVVTITNGNPDSEEPGVCTAAVVVPPTTTPEEPVVPTGGGGGAGQVEVLPATSSDATLQTTAWIAGALVLLAGLSVGGVLWYRHNKA